jgi:protoporphyrinogen/coproporphyrinogen III oxidase
MRDTDVVVLGGGIAGLVVGYRLGMRNLDVCLLERFGYVGGSIRSIKDDAYLFEAGPNTIQRSNQEIEDLIESLGLTDEIIRADSSAENRFVVRGGKPVKVPTGPASLARTRLLSWSARLSLLREPFKRRGSKPDESVADFVRRRLHAEILEYGIDPMVGGIHAGDPEALSLRLAFPRMHALEANHRSLIFGALSPSRRRQGHRPAYKMFSFQGGLTSLPERLANSGRFNIQTDAEVNSVAFGDDERWIVTTADGRSFRARAVVWTLPLVEESPGLVVRGMELPLPIAEYASVAVVSAAYTSRTILHSLDGFGMLVPSVEASTRILGTLFTSSIFPSRSPEDAIVLTSFVGGTRHPRHFDLSDRDLVEMVHSDNTRILGITSSPRKTVVTRWPHAIPQYNVGYDAILDRIQTLEQDLKGLVFAGNFVRGVSVPDTIASAYEAANRLTDRLSVR